MVVGMVSGARLPRRPLRYRISRYLKEWLFTLCCLAVMAAGCATGLMLAVSAGSGVAPPSQSTTAPDEPPGAVVLYHSPTPSTSATP